MDDRAPAAWAGRRDGVTQMNTLTLLESIGNTPLVELLSIPPRGSRVRILAKLEGSNPGGSVKDRPAKWMIEHAERTGAL